MLINCKKIVINECMGAGMASGIHEKRHRNGVFRPVFDDLMEKIRHILPFRCKVNA